MTQIIYNETVEARRFVQLTSRFYTEEERAILDAIRANVIRQKARFGVKFGDQRKDWQRELDSVANALPIDDPLVVAALSKGEATYRNNVLDRIWREHRDEINVPRCDKCKCILKTSLAQQCLWCGNDWH